MRLGGMSGAPLYKGLKLGDEARDGRVLGEEKDEKV